MKYATLACSLLLSTSAIFAQGALGTITGTVTDPSSAAIASAEISATNTANGQVYKAVSTDTGNYTVAQLPVGSYTLTITMKGFKTYKREGLDLAAAQVMRIDIPLEVGSQTEAVTVTAEASLLKTESGEMTHNVTTTELSELPILSTGGTFSNNTSGYRDPLALARLIPGIQYGANGGFVVNGQPDNVFGTKSLQIRSEGQPAGGTGFLSGYTSMGQASVDAIQEVAVQASNYAAEYGAAGAIVNQTLKSGTNQLHGSIYDYAANDILNAAQPYTGVNNPTRRHDYGVTVGGPVVLPKIYNGVNRSFFFFSFEEFREDVMVGTIAAGNPTVPTAAYRNGDFTQVITGNGNVAGPLPYTIGGAPYVDPLGNSYPSGTIFDPLNFRNVTCAVLPSGVTPNCNIGSTYQVRLPYATNNVIPASNFDPVSVRLLNLVPKPVGPNSASGLLGGNYQNPFLSQTRSKIPSVKGDQSFGSKTHVSFYGSGTLMDAPYTATNGNAEGFPSPITGARGSFIYTKTYRLNYDYTVSPKLLLHLGAGWYQTDFHDDAAATTSYNSSAPQSCTNSPSFGGLLDKTCTGGLGPWVTANGQSGAIINRQFPYFVVGSASPGTGGMSNLGPFVQGPSFERRPSAVVNATYVKGNHTYKIGGEWRQERFPSTSYTATVGQYTFGANSTMQTALQGVSGNSSGVFGFPFASFLRGDATNFLIAQPGSTTTTKKQMALFLQDTWRVTRKLTMDYGLRWDYATYGHEEHGMIPNFSATTPNPSAAGHPGAQVFEQTCGCQFASNYPYAIGPRVGFAYQINSKTVLRGGAGIVYTATTPVGGGAGANTDTTSNPAFAQWVGQLQNGIPTTLHPVFPNLTPNAGQGPGAIVGAPPFLDPNSDRPARQYQWSVSIQRELTKNLVLEASYVGNRGVWWPAGNLTALNVLSVQSLKNAGFTVGNLADEALLTQTVGNLTPAQQSQLAAAPYHWGLPYSNFPGSQTVRQSLYPFPQYINSFFGFNFPGPNIFPTNAPLGKTWYDSLQVVLSKRFSHGLTANVNYTYAKNMDLMSTPDYFNYNLGKNISTNDLPHQFRLSAEYRTPRLKGGNSVLSNKIVSAVLGDWALGTYLQYQSAPALGRPTSFTLNPISNYLGYGPGPAQLVPGVSPWSINWTDLNGVHHTDPLDINCHCFDPTKTPVLNPAAWTNVPDGVFANDFSVLRDYRGFRYPTENLNIGRSFRFKERVTLSVRVEFTNAFNRTQLPQPNATAFTFQGITTQTGGTYNGAINGGFGSVVPIGGTTGARTGLFVGRLTF